MEYSIGLRDLVESNESPLGRLWTSSEADCLVTANRLTPYHDRPMWMGLPQPPLLGTQA